MIYDKKTISTHRLRFTLALITFCRWCHDWLRAHYDCGSYTWKVIYNSLGIDYVNHVVYGYLYADGWVQDCSNSSAVAMELL